MQEKRFRERYAIVFPVEVRWKDEDDREVIEKGQTEHIGRTGVLVHLNRRLPEVGSEVGLTVFEDMDKLVEVKAQVLRLERNAAHPQCMLLLTEETEEWEQKVWRRAAELASLAEEGLEEDW
ncbi:MAG: hypothetical protein D6687_09845 [Acidobacteria bacterium]|nr:MAG: hypothetical protein D6687_09845 [Acidobacteriota bacterium]GIU81236.1 MAG: hypothetical protein KatS3mg006_0300 [Pyrinomonadaceae bacterium]